MLAPPSPDLAPPLLVLAPPSPDLAPPLHFLAVAPDQLVLPLGRCQQTSPISEVTEREIEAMAVDPGPKKKKNQSPADPEGERKIPKRTWEQ